MKLRNKKTGEIVDVESLGHADSLKGKFGYQVTLSWKIDEHLDACKTYNSLAELNEEWEDYEETKDHWHIGCEGDVFIDNTERYFKIYSSIGNDFDSREEAEKAVEKLKAWKRLKDIGFHFLGWNSTYKGDNVDFYLDWINSDSKEQLTKDLDLLFGGEK